MKSALGSVEWPIVQIASTEFILRIKSQRKGAKDAKVAKVAKETERLCLKFLQLVHMSHPLLM